MTFTETWIPDSEPRAYRESSAQMARTPTPAAASRLPDAAARATKGARFRRERTGNGPADSGAPVLASILRNPGACEGAMRRYASMIGDWNWPV